MNEQHRINTFSLEAHRLAIARLRERPECVPQALAVLERWRQQAGGPSHCDPYWNEWESMLQQGIDTVERAVCVETDHAATLRSVSPLGRFVSAADRYRLLRQVRETA
jgi:hypothetical protein